MKRFLGTWFCWKKRLAVKMREFCDLDVMARMCVASSRERSGGKTLSVIALAHVWRRAALCWYMMSGTAQAWTLAFTFVSALVRGPLRNAEWTSVGMSRASGCVGEMFLTPRSPSRRS